MNWLLPAGQSRDSAVITNTIGTSGQARWVQNRHAHQLQALTVSVNATDPHGTFQQERAPVAGLASSEGFVGHNDDVGYVRRHDAAHCESEAARCTYAKRNGAIEEN